VTTCRFKPKVGDYVCLHPIPEHADIVGLCIFHLLSISEKLPEHPAWKLSALLAHHDWPGRIRDQFHKLVDDTEDNPTADSHDFTGFWLPSINLRSCKFTKPVTFQEAVFLQATNFSAATFIQKVNFFRAIFRGRTDFISTEFLGPSTQFVQVRFEQDTLFGDTVFGGSVSFVQAVIVGDVDFLHAEFLDESNFSHIKVLKDGALTFNMVDLGRAHFLNTNLETVDFRDVRWFRAPNGRWASRRALWSEFAPLKKPESRRNYEALSLNYRELVLNSESKRDFESAEDFHIGEMEIKRRLAESECTTAIGKRLSKHFNAYALYWKVSHYGTSYIVALAWLLFWVLLVFPLVFLFSGFDMLSPDTGKLVERISYQMQPDHTQVLHWLSDWFKAASFSLSVSTFQRSRLYEASGRLAMISLPIESVIVAGQSALLLFAIRRRFKR